MARKNFLLSTALALLVISLPVMASEPEVAPELAIPEDPQLPQEPSVAEGGFAAFGINDPREWKFVMGPRGPDAILLLNRTTEFGGVIFRCTRRTGDVRMAVLFRDLTGDAGLSGEVSISVGRQTHPLTMTVETALPTGQTAPVLEAQGVAPIDIMAAMAQLRDHPEVISLRMGTHQLEIPLSGNRSIYELGARICQGWREEVGATSIPAAGPR